MPKRESHRIKDKEQYKALRREGASKEKAARISNASNKTSRSAVGRKGGKSQKYEEWTQEALRKQAKKWVLKADQL